MICVHLLPELSHFLFPMTMESSWNSRREHTCNQKSCLSAFSILSNKTALFSLEKHFHHSHLITFLPSPSLYWLDTRNHQYHLWDYSESSSVLLWGVANCWCLNKAPLLYRQPIILGCTIHQDPRRSSWRSPGSVCMTPPGHGTSWDCVMFLRAGS